MSRFHGYITVFWWNLAWRYLDTWGRKNSTVYSCIARAKPLAATNIKKIDANILPFHNNRKQPQKNDTSIHRPLFSNASKVIIKCCILKFMFPQVYWYLNFIERCRIVAIFRNRLCHMVCEFLCRNLVVRSVKKCCILMCT